MAPSAEFPFGPYHHRINKGGLSHIIRTNMLRASAARSVAGGSSAVRAHSGAYLPGRPSAASVDRAIYIDFYARTQPSVHPTNGIATWYMDDECFLPIKLTAVRYNDGEAVDPNNIPARHA